MSKSWKRIDNFKDFLSLKVDYRSKITYYGHTESMCAERFFDRIISSYVLSTHRIDMRGSLIRSNNFRLRIIYTPNGYVRNADPIEQFQVQYYLHTESILRIVDPIE
uniref:Uncharacterized protein n=1 Tax=Parascaris univalens TaxID=6257 RepID=A0A914ZN53_PARUN